MRKVAQCVQQWAPSLVATAVLATAPFTAGAVIVGSAYQGGASGTYSNTAQPDWFSSATITSATLTGASFSASGSDKLVVSIATKKGDNAGAAVSGITYNGASLTPVGLSATTFSRTYQNMFYLDNVASDGDLAITFASATEAYTVYLFALDGTALGVGNTISVLNNGTAPVTTPTLTSTTDNAFLLWEAGRNVNGGNPLSVASTSGSATYSTDTSAYGGRGKSLAVWTTGESAGGYTITVNGTNGTGGFVGAVFEAAVPEPASLAIIGLGGLIMIKRRRA